MTRTRHLAVMILKLGVPRLQSFAITKYELKNGRRYHAYNASQYVFPDDEIDLERMNIEHHNQGSQLGTLRIWPLSNPQEVLDIGTGSGIWYM